MKRKTLLMITLASIVCLALLVSKNVFAGHPTITCEEAYKNSGCIGGDESCYMWVDNETFCFFDFSIYWN